MVVVPLRLQRGVVAREAGRKKTLSQEWAKSEPKLSQVILLSQE
jgi:hypothetical protein